MSEAFVKAVLEGKVSRPELKSESLGEGLRGVFNERRLHPLDAEDEWSLRLVSLVRSHQRRHYVRVKCMDLFVHDELGLTFQMFDLLHTRLAEGVHLPEGDLYEAWGEQDADGLEVLEMLGDYAEGGAKFDGSLVRLQGIRDCAYRVGEGDYGVLRCERCKSVGLGYGTVGWECAARLCDFCVRDFVEAWTNASEEFVTTRPMWKSLGEIERAKQRIKEWNWREQLRIREAKAAVRQREQDQRWAAKLVARAKAASVAKLGRLRRRKLSGQLDLTSQLGALAALAQPRKASQNESTAK
jgi:hypothetical protein